MPTRPNPRSRLARPAPRVTLVPASMRAPIAGVGLLAVLSITAAHAQTGTVSLDAAEPGVDGGRAGFALVGGRRYQGNDQYALRVLPSVDYQWAQGWFAGTGNGLGYAWTPNRVWQYGLRASYDLGRKERRSAELRGLGDVKFRPELGGFLNFNPIEAINLGSALRYGAGNGHNGLRLDLSAGTGYPFAPGWLLAASLSASWVNAALQRNEFGVDAAQSQRSGLPLYQPGAGWQSAQAALVLSHDFSPRLSASVVLSRERLLGDTARSPITRERISNTGVATLLWAF